jgi:hypothetical protein
VKSCLFACIRCGMDNRVMMSLIHTLLLRLVFNHHHALRGQIDDLAAFHLQAFHHTQILLTLLARLDGVNYHQIGRLREHQGPSWMPGLASSLPPALFAQTLGLPMKAIGGGRQVTIVAVLLQLLLQGVHLLSQQHEIVLHVGDHLISLRKLLLQQALFLSQGHHFFFGCHVPTVFGSGLLGKPSRTRE